MAKTKSQNLKVNTATWGFMEFNNWGILITLIIAVYGAILSTFTFWNTKQENKREIKVKASHGLIKKPTGVTPPLVILTAMNTGRKTVSLTNTGLILPNKDRPYLIFTQPDSFVPFPHDLVEGKSCQVWLTAKELANDLVSEGYSGRISLRGYYRDAIGDEYRSKPMKFNIERARKNSDE